jgi:hypothetical protein
MAAANDFDVGNPGDDGVVLEIMVRDVRQNLFGDVLRANDFELEVFREPSARSPGRHFF